DKGELEGVWGLGTYCFLLTPKGRCDESLEISATEAK
ncbi:MAG: hypothetical protein ACD_23C00975G0002, partial [uncultured bacterium]